jgi:hypothetical protein
MFRFVPVKTSTIKKIVGNSGRIARLGCLGRLGSIWEVSEVWEVSWKHLGSLEVCKPLVKDSCKALGFSVNASVLFRFVRASPRLIQ